MNGHSELKLDALRNIQPMELGVKQMCQAAVELPRATIKGFIGFYFLQLKLFGQYLYMLAKDVGS